MHEKSACQKNLKNIVHVDWWDGTKTKIDDGQRCRCFMPFEVHSTIAVGPKSSCDIAKGPHRLERMSVLRRELKKIRGKR